MLTPALVTQVEPLMVRVEGATTAAPATSLGGYQPKVNDLVAVESFRGGLIVVASPGAIDDPVHPDSRTFMNAASTLVNGGGTKEWTGTAFRFSNRFMVGMSLGRGPHGAASGFFSANPLTAGLAIPGYGGSAGATVDANGYVGLSSWTVLWAYPRYGFGGSTTMDYALSYYGSDFVAPPHWTPLATRNGDDGKLYLATGEVLDPDDKDVFLQPINGWEPYTTGLTSAHTPRYRKRNGIVHMAGLIRNLGAVTSDNFFVMPTGYRPSGQVMTAAQTSGGGNVRFDVAISGHSYIYQATKDANASFSWVSIACSFPAA